MRKLALFINVLFFAAISTNLRADDITFKASAPPAVVAGTQFNLAYTINANNCTDLRIPSSVTDNFNILMGPTQSLAASSQYINGKSTHSITTTFTFVLSAKKEGEFNIEPAAVKVGNAEYKSNAVKIKVLPPDKTAQADNRQQQGSSANQANQTAGISNENIFMRVYVSNRSVYEQEGFLMTCKLYTLYDISGASNVKYPEFEGFLAQDIEQKDIQWTMEHYNGRNYNVAVLKETVLYPQHSGQLKIGSAKMDVTLRIRNQSRGRSLLDDFFSDPYQNVKKELTSPPVTIDVKPLPSGKPSAFSGAVGNYTLSSEINKTSLKENEAVTIKLTIKGNGNIKLLKTPEIKFPSDFETYDPKVDNNIKVTTAGASGVKTIEYMAIPRHAGDFEIPAIQFAYFDTKAGQYKTLSTEPYNLHVEKGEGGANAPVVSNFTNRENVKFLGKDIRYIKRGNVRFMPNRDIFFGSLLYVMAYVMMAFLFAVFFVIYRKQVRENANIALVRTKKANKTAVRRLKQAEQFLKANREEAFYEEVLRALWGYLSDKLNMPQSNLTRDNVSAELTKYGVETELSAEFIEIINTCEFARYAPNRASGAMDKLFNETIEAIGKMENTIKK